MVYDQVTINKCPRYEYALATGHCKASMMYPGHEGSVKHFHQYSKKEKNNIHVWLVFQYL